MGKEVHIAGVAMTQFGIFPDRSIVDMTTSVVNDALADAGLTASDVGWAFFGNTTQSLLEGQLMTGGQIALRPSGIAGIPIVNVENACATGTTAFTLAVNQVLSGTCDVALAVGVERMNIGDRAKTMSVFDGVADVNNPQRVFEEIDDIGGAIDDAELGARSPLMDVYAAFARLHMKTFGSTVEQLAAVASKNHGHSVHNERAHYRKPMSIEDIMNARKLAHPLTVPMCAPVTDGAAAAIVCLPTGGKVPSRSVRVRANGIATGLDREWADYSQHVTKRAADRAYERAGVSPGEVDVAEVHDATAFGELLVSELVGLAPMGMGGPMALQGASSLGGRIPINPSGGLESKGHPLAATGLGQIFEIVTQLRGEAGGRQVPGARIGLVENGGGYQRGEEAVAVVTILGG
ncbi:thiolase family protein [Mycolicibacterium stellerae]|uniref:thiolase family protein n=1 Tax=Mycolicibacterium stellerae TaxID=2358193 RepID=UPI000F0B7D53|nr:thiolase family protein [Mycolicibacterium stellerae]